MNAPDHPVVQFAKTKLEAEYVRFVSTGGANWSDLAAAMMRLQQACQFNADDLDQMLDAALLQRMGATSWKGLCVEWGALNPDHD